MTPETIKELKDNGMTDEEIQLVTMPISQIQKKMIPYALMAREKEIQIIEKLNEAWVIANPRKNFLESEDEVGVSNLLLRVEGSDNTVPARPKLGDAYDYNY